MDFVENNYIETIEKYNKVTGSEGTPISKLANQLKKVLTEQPEKANNRNGYARVVIERKIEELKMKIETLELELKRDQIQKKIEENLENK